MAHDKEYSNEPMLEFEIEEKNDRYIFLHDGRDGDEEEQTRNSNIKLFTQKGFLESINNSEIAFRITDEGRNYIEKLKKAKK